MPIPHWIALSAHAGNRNESSFGLAFSVAAGRPENMINTPTKKIAAPAIFSIDRYPLKWRAPTDPTDTGHASPQNSLPAFR
jgi:hypothetical protein